MAATTPRYARIAAQIEARIRDGDLPPGARVPSAREIVRDHAVAIATATRVLATLRDRGLVVTRAGSGTVVAPLSRARGAATGSRGHAGPTGLGVDRIVATAVTVADHEGLDAVTMRRLAAELGSAPMSLYRHVGDKDRLVLLMLDAALGETPLPARPPGGWRPAAEIAARAMWAAFRRHPWAAGALSLTRPQPVSAALRWTEWMLAALDTTGLGPTEQLDVHLVLVGHVRGAAVNLEPEAVAQATTGLTGDEWTETQLESLRALADEAPHLQRMLSTEYDLDLDALFERGLGYLLDGLALHLTG